MSSKLKRKALGIQTGWTRPAASILSIIFCLDLACLTKLA